MTLVVEVEMLEEKNNVLFAVRREVDLMKEERNIDHMKVMNSDGVVVLVLNGGIVVGIGQIVVVITCCS